MSTPRVIPVPLGFVKAFLVQGARTILVDTGMAGGAERIARAARRIGLELADLSLVVLTHAHADHVGGVREIAAMVRCPVAIHRGDADALRSGRYPLGRPVGRVMGAVMGMARGRAGERAMPAAAHGFEPGLVLEGAVSLEPWGVDGSVEPTPGHTPGSVSLFLAGGEVIVGDLLRGSLAAGGVARWPFVAIDIAENRRSARQVLERGPTRIWTSHGGPLSRMSSVRALLERGLAEPATGPAAGRR